MTFWGDASDSPDPRVMYATADGRIVGTRLGSGRMALEFEVTGGIDSPRRARNRLGAAVRNGKPDSEVAKLRRDLELAKLDQHVRKVAESFPPLTDAERERLADLLSYSAQSDVLLLVQESGDGVE